MKGKDITELGPIADAIKAAGKKKRYTKKENMEALRLEREVWLRTQASRMGFVLVRKKVWERALRICDNSRETYGLKERKSE